MTKSEGHRVGAVQLEHSAMQAVLLRSLQEIGSSLAAYTGSLGAQQGQS